VTSRVRARLSPPIGGLPFLSLLKKNLIESAQVKRAVGLTVGDQMRTKEILDPAHWSKAGMIFGSGTAYLVAGGRTIQLPRYKFVVTANEAIGDEYCIASELVVAVGLDVSLGEATRRLRRLAGEFDQVGDGNGQLRHCGEFPSKDGEWPGNWRIFTFEGECVALIDADSSAAFLGNRHLRCESGRLRKWTRVISPYVLVTMRGSESRLRVAARLRRLSDCIDSKSISKAS
jgi:hypothetical protein